MLKFVTLALVLLIALSANAQREQKIVLDSFTAVTPVIIIQTGAGGVSPSAPLTSTAFSSDNGIVGGQRDTLLQVDSSTANQIFTTNVDSGTWVTSTPNGGDAFAVLQYDGQDNTVNVGSPQSNGLNNYDVTQSGGDSFVFDIVTDVSSTFTITVYQGSSSCERKFTLPGEPGGSPKTYEARYTDFTNVNGGSCGVSFTSLGAIELLVDALANVDVIVSRFATFGPVAESPSRTPTPTPSPAAPPPPDPSATRTPIPSSNPPPPPPPPMSMCECDCPVFRCGVVYKIHDDDDDEVDDDTHDDDDLVYRPVYYGPVDDDFDALTGDDDENEFISFQGGLTLTGIHDDDNLTYSNNAGVLSTSALLVATILVMLF